MTKKQKVSRLITTLLRNGDEPELALRLIGLPTCLVRWQYKQFRRTRHFLNRTKKRTNRCVLRDEVKSGIILGERS